MTSIMNAVTALVNHVVDVAPSWLSLFVRMVPSTDIGGTGHVQVTVLGLFVVVLPLVGLGIGVIRRLVKIRG